MINDLFSLNHIIYNRQLQWFICLGLYFWVRGYLFRFSKYFIRGTFLDTILCLKGNYVRTLLPMSSAYVDASSQSLCSYLANRAYDILSLINYYLFFFIVLSCHLLFIVFGSSGLVVVLSDLWVFCVVVISLLLSCFYLV